MKHPELSCILEQLHEQLQEIYHERLCRIILYGSQARSTAQPDSDVDVLIVLQDPVDFVVEVERTSHLITALCLEHHVLIACTFIGQQRFVQQQSGFLRNVHREGISL